MELRQVAAINMEPLTETPVMQSLSDAAIDEGQSPPIRSYLTNPSATPGTSQTADETASSIPSMVRSSDFNENDRAEIELTRLLTVAREKKDRLHQAIGDVQIPIIQKNLEESRQRADSVLEQLRSIRESLNAPPPTLVQGQLSLGDMLAQGIGMIFGGRPDQLINEGLAGADKRNQLSYQNELNRYQLNRENLLQLAEFFQKQALGEQSTQSQLEELGLRAMIDSNQIAQQQAFQSSEAEKQRRQQELDKAWSQFYSANTDGEVLAAAKRLHGLDPDNTPDQGSIDKAVNSARTRRGQAALEYYKATVGRTIDAYQGVVPESVKKDLETRIKAIAQEFDVDPKLFGEIPTEAFYSRQLAEEKLQQVKDEWKDRFKWMADKERNDRAEALAKIRIAQQRANIAQQSANTSAARLELDKVKGTVSTEQKAWRSKLNTQSLNLKSLEGEYRAIDEKLNAKDSKGKPKYIPYAEKVKLQDRKRELELKREGIKAQIEEIQTQIRELDEVSTANVATPQQTYVTRSGAKVRF